MKGALESRVTGVKKIGCLYKSNFSGLISNFSGDIEGKHYRSNHFVFESRYLRFFLDPTCHPNSGFVTFMPQPTHLAISDLDVGFQFFKYYSKNIDEPDLIILVRAKIYLPHKA